MSQPLQINAGGLRFHAVAAGPPDGRLTFLLHGFPETGHAWRQQLSPLAGAGLRLVAPDQRGYGRSSRPRGKAAYALDHLADDIVHMAHALGHHSFQVVGHDWGGLVGWVLAARPDSPVERLAILNAPHPATLWPEMLRHPTQALRSSYIALFQLPWVAEALLAAADFRALKLALTASSRPGAFDADTLQRYRQAWAAPGALTGMLNWYRALHLAPDLAGAPIRQPVRLLWGGRDTALHPGLADRALAHCTQAELIRLPAATHWLHHEEPALVSRLLAEFLAA